MSDQHFSHESLLSKLRDYLAKERYATATVPRCMGVARHFLAYLRSRILTSAPRDQQTLWKRQILPTGPDKPPRWKSDVESMGWLDSL